MGKKNFWFFIVLSAIVVFALTGCASTTIADMPAPGKERCIVVFNGGDWDKIDDMFLSSLGKTAISIPAGKHTFAENDGSIAITETVLSDGSRWGHYENTYGKKVTYDFEPGKIYSLDYHEGKVTEIRSGKVYIGRILQADVSVGWLGHGLAGYVGPRLGIGILSGNLNTRIVGKASAGMVFPIPRLRTTFSAQAGGLVEFCSSGIGIGFGGGIMTIMDEESTSAMPKGSQPYVELEFLSDGGLGGFFAQYYFGESELLPSIGVGMKFIFP
jgi:hypothetical protein